MRCSITGKALCWFALSLLWLGAAVVCSAQTSVVDANRYDALWLWAGVVPQSALVHARSIYILDAEVRPGKALLISQRPAIPHVQHAEVWMVVGVETLDWSPELYTQVLGDLERWRQAGNRIAGLQIDFRSGAVSELLTVVFCVHAFAENSYNFAWSLPGPSRF